MKDETVPQIKFGVLDLIEKYNNPRLVLYLAKISVVDRFLAATFLRLLPSFVTPNHLTLFRVMTVPVIIYLLLNNLYDWGLVLFTISAFSDALDGALARTKHKITDWGIVCDPIADKLLIGSVSLTTVAVHVSLWLAVSIIAIELFVIFSVALKLRGRVVPAKWSAKIKMILQCLGVGLLLLHLAVPGVAGLLTVATYILYLALFFGVLGHFVYRSI
jgi:CDP-diacylglycerol--glycerol-3-phosphate 3-phosphatidyltransferase